MGSIIVILVITIKTRITKSPIPLNITKKNQLNQIQFLRKSWLQLTNTDWNSIIPTDLIQKLLADEINSYRDRIFNPIVTLTLFIFQVLDSDQSCRNAIAKYLATFKLTGEQCSYNTGAYCKARLRLSEKLCKQLLTKSGDLATKNIKNIWKWKGFNIKMVDGTTVTMPDTPANQSEYPQPASQEPGLGFPIARLVTITCLATGTVLDYAMSAWRGKETGEHALFREIIGCLVPDDLLLADRYYCSYFLIAYLMSEQIDAVFQQHGARKTDFRRGKRLGAKDHLVNWKKPARPDWMDKETYKKIPSEITVRETRVKGIVIVSTLLDPKAIQRSDLAQLYTQRWLIEVDLKFIKEVMKMDILRCKTPAMIRKEISIHLLTYNLIRDVIAQAATRHHLSPRTISFKGTLQLIGSSHSMLIFMVEEDLMNAYTVILNAIIQHKIGNRPGRSNPRVVKRRPKPYPRKQNNAKSNTCNRKAA
jgi:hypothetical protein